VDNHLVAVLKGDYHRLQQAVSGVEAQVQLSVGRATLVEGLDPQRPLCRLQPKVGLITSSAATGPSRVLEVGAGTGMLAARAWRIRRGHEG
jgi:hypothetical protein